MSEGRQMGGHFYPFRKENGEWVKAVNAKPHEYISPTGAQMPRLLEAAQASKIYRATKQKIGSFFTKWRRNCWGTIGNASTSEGSFMTLMPLGSCGSYGNELWDDEYGISVSNREQTTKESISETLAGFQHATTQNGIEIIRVKGWDYLALIEAYDKAAQLARKVHIPVLVHVTELTQPLGHSSSGSHERYKTKARLEWERI